MSFEKWLTAWNALIVELMKFFARIRCFGFRKLKDKKEFCAWKAYYKNNFYSILISINLMQGSIKQSNEFDQQIENDQAKNQ